MHVLHPWIAILSLLVEPISVYNQEHSLCNPYLYKNEVPPWFAVQMGSVAESVAAKLHYFPWMSKLYPIYFMEKMILTLKVTAMRGYWHEDMMWYLENINVFRELLAMEIYIHNLPCATPHDIMQAGCGDMLTKRLWGNRWERRIWPQHGARGGIRQNFPSM